MRRAMCWLYETRRAETRENMKMRNTVEKTTTKMKRRTVCMVRKEEGSC